MHREQSPKGTCLVFEISLLEPFRFENQVAENSHPRLTSHVSRLTSHASRLTQMLRRSGLDRLGQALR